MRNGTLAFRDNLNDFIVVYCFKHEQSSESLVEWCRAGSVEECSLKAIHLGRGDLDRHAVDRSNGRDGVDGAKESKIRQKYQISQFVHIHLHFHQSDYRKIYNYSILHLYCTIYSLDETDSA
jgi:hypothetical protein